MSKKALLGTSALAACALVACALAACGGPSESSASNAQTAGGEDTAMAPALRTTTPIPVPQPATARESLSEPLQRLWTAIEETVAIRPPDAPTEDTMEAVQAWSQGPFSQWLQARVEANNRTAAIFDEIPETPEHERGVAAALLAYALEDFAAGIGGAPVPTEVASDPELLEIYRRELTIVVNPLAGSAALRYAYCQQRLLPLGDDSEWLPWRAYCVQRGQDVISIYNLAPEDGESSDVEGAI